MCVCVWVPGQENIGILQQEREVLEHGLLIGSRGAAEVAEEAAAGHHHFVRRVLLLVHFNSLAARSLNGRLILHVRLRLSSTTYPSQPIRLLFNAINQTIVFY